MVKSSDAVMYSLTLHCRGSREPGPAVHDLELAISWLGPTHASIAACGEIDAANADRFLDYVLGKAVLCRSFVLDLTGIEFFSSAGYRALSTLDRRCTTAGVAWDLDPSAGVRRVLEICDGYTKSAHGFSPAAAGRS